MAVTGWAAASTITTALVVASGTIEPLADVPAAALHSVNQQLAAVIFRSSEAQHWLAQAQPPLEGGLQMQHDWLAATQTGIVAALKWQQIDIEIQADAGYVAFRVPVAPTAGRCEVRYQQATADKPAEVQLISSIEGCRWGAEELNLSENVAHAEPAAVHGG